VATTDGTWRIELSAGTRRVWPTERTAAASICVAIAIGLFLAARRLSGALAVPLPPLQLAVTAALVLGWAVAARALVPRSLAAWASATVLILFAVACSFPGERAVDWLVWLSAFGVFLVSQNMRIAFPTQRSSPAVTREQILQQLTRSRTTDGHDVVRGTLVAEFAPGERTVTLFVAFCPPFERLPHVELESAAGAKVIQTLHNGAQLDVRLPRAAETSTTATVDIYATDAE